MAINGSPRKGGNTDTLIDQVITGFQSKTPAEVEKILVIEHDIKYCSGCLACMEQDPGTDTCVLRDDMAEILRHMVASDALIFGTPNHMRTVTAPLLNFFARMLPLFEMRRELDERGTLIGAEYTSLLAGKKAAMVFSQGDSFYSSALAHEVLERNLMDFKIRRVGDVISLGNLKRGAVAEKKDDLKQAFDLGVKLASWSGLK
jgi:multimeric flavodoxin WrbA